MKDMKISLIAGNYPKDAGSEFWGSINKGKMIKSLCERV